jgi:hypothetical protein
MNIYIPSLKNTYAYKYEELQFMATDSNDLFLEILKNRKHDIYEIIKENDEFEIDIEHIQNCIERLESINNKIEMQKIKKNIMYLLYNSKQKVLENKKKI